MGSFWCHNWETSRSLVSMIRFITQLKRAPKSSGEPSRSHTVDGWKESQGQPPVGCFFQTLANNGINNLNLKLVSWQPDFWLPTHQQYHLPPKKSRWRFVSR